MPEINLDDDNDGEVMDFTSVPSGEVVKRNEVPYDGWRSPPC